MRANMGAKKERREPRGGDIRFRPTPLRTALVCFDYAVSVVSAVWFFTCSMTSCSASLG